MEGDSKSPEMSVTIVGAAKTVNFEPFSMWFHVL